MMLQLLVGMLLGAMISTETGRSIGNQVGNAAIGGLKKVAGAALPEESVGKEGAHEADPDAM